MILSVEACTSFAVYDEKTLYGMNFDFQDTDLLFSVEIVDAIKAFSMAFQAGDEFVPTVRLNTRKQFGENKSLPVSALRKYLQYALV